MLVLYKTKSNKKKMYLFAISFLLIVFFARMVYGAQILTTTVSGHQMKIWINSKEEPIGVLARLTPFYDQNEKRVFAFYLCGREKFTDAMVFGDYDLKNYSYFGSLLKTEGDELTEILRKAYETAEKADRLGVEIKDTRRIGYLAGNFSEISVELRRIGNKRLRCYLTFKNKSKTGTENDSSYEVYFDQILEVEMFYKYLAEQRDKTERFMPVIEKMLTERANLKQQLQ